jgi:ADP-ribose pyrophosphatase
MTERKNGTSFRSPSGSNDNRSRSAPRVILDSEELLKLRRFRVVSIRQQIGDHVVQRDVIRHSGAVTIIPVVDANHICLIRNYRVAVDETLIELPAGTLEPGEDPQQTAERELIEETGYRAASCRLIHEFYLSPGILDEKMQLFLATGLTPGEACREPGEQIENLVVSWEEALQLVGSGKIRDAKTMIGILYYNQLRG